MITAPATPQSKSPTSGLSSATSRFELVCPQDLVSHRDRGTSTVHVAIKSQQNPMAVHLVLCTTTPSCHFLTNSTSVTGFSIHTVMFLFHQFQSISSFLLISQTLHSRQSLLCTLRLVELGNKQHPTPSSSGFLQLCVAVMSVIPHTNCGAHVKASRG